MKLHGRIAKTVRHFPRILTASVATLLAGAVVNQAHAATVYWDTNGPSAEATDIVGDATGIWNAANAVWNPLADGTGATAAWLAGDIAVFSAGTNASGPFTVSVVGTHDIGGLAFEEGTVTLTGGTLNWTVAGDLSAASGLTATINSDFTGSAALTRTTGGTVILGGNNSGFSGLVNLNAGVTRILTSTGLGTNTITLTNTATVLELAGGVTMANAITVSGTGNEKTIRATGNAVLNSVITQNETSVGNFRLEANSGFTLTVNSNIGGTAGLRTGGSGTKILTGNNTYTGNTQILGGITIFTAATNLGTTGAVSTIQIGTTTTGATLRYEGAGDTVADALSLNGTTGGTTLDASGTGALIFSNAAAIVAGAGTKTFTLTGTSTSENRIDGIIQNNSGTNLTNLSKTGAGTWVLTGANTYNNTTINGNGGTLRLTGVGRIGTAALTVNAGTLDVAGAADQAITNLTMGGGTAGSSATITLGAGRTLTLGGTVTFSATNNNLTSTITGDAGAVLNFGGAARTFTIGDSTGAGVDMLIGANVTLQNDAGGGLIKAGAGTLRIEGTNSLTGATEIQAGALSGNFGTGNLRLNGGVIETSGTFALPLGAGASQVQWVGGGGFSASGGALTVTLAGAPDPLVWGTTPSFVATGSSLIFGSTSADDVVTFTHNIDLNDTGAALDRTVSVTNNTAVATDKAVLSGVLSNSVSAGGLIKAGNGVLELTGANTFTGPVTVTGGTLQFSTVTDSGGAASNLGQGTDIALGGILQFIGATSQATNRTITLTAASTLDASGTGGATITYNGAIAAAALELRLDGTGSGILAGVVTQTGTTADLVKNGVGIWRIDAAQVIGDDITINGGTLILNVANVFAGDDINLRAATLVLGIDGAITNAMDDLNVSSETASGGILDINGTTGSAPSDLVLGSATLSGSVIDSVGGGSFGATGTFNLRNGVISASLGSAAVLTKTTIGTVTLSGANTFTGSSTVTLGSLILDYTTNNGEKLSDSAALAVAGGIVTLNGSTAAPTTETVGSFTVSAGASRVAVNHGTGQTAQLNLNAITRSLGGTVNFTMSAGSSILTSSPNGSGAVLGGWATIGGTNFATVSAGSIVPLASTPKDNPVAWAPSDDLTDSGGYTGALSTINVNSLRFNASGLTSTVTVKPLTVLTIASGGILVTSNVGSGAASIVGGTLASGTGNEIIVHQNNLTTPFTIGSKLTGSTALTKSGNGTLVLNGTNNDNTGQTTINEGTLLVSGGNAIGDGSLVVLKDGPGAVLDLNNGSETISGLSGGGSSGGTVAIGAGSLTINNASGSTRTYVGVLTGSGTLIKSGANTQEFEGDSTGFTGTVVINQGLVHLDSTSGALRTATSFTLNGGELLTDQDQSGSEDRIGTNAAIILNNTAGTRGLWLRNENQDATRTDSVGVITLGSGHNVIQADPANSGASTIADLIADTVTRTNHSTALVRGLNLGNSSGRRGQIRFDVTQPTLVGGAVTAGTTTIGILPYLVGDNAGITGLGNTFVTNTGSTNGLRPLSTVEGAGEEYIHNEAGYNGLAAGVLTNNVRFTANPGAPLTNTITTGINSLVLDSSVAALTVNGDSGVSLQITSGAILATTTVAANGITLGGFSGITAGTGNDYIIYVTTAANTLTVNSPLTTATPLVKSGIGTLSLTNAANAFTDVYFNQGTILVNDLDKLGTGTLNFAGGILKLDTAFTDDVSSKTINVTTGGGTIDVSAVTTGTVLANGIDDTTGGSADSMTFITRGSATTGLLTIQGSSSFTGTTIFNHVSISSGVTNSVVLNGDTNAAINGNVHIGSTGAINTSSFDVVVALGASEQIVDTATLTLRGTDGEQAYFKLMGFTETVAGISDTTTEGVIENLESSEAGITTNGNLIVNSASDFSYNGFMRNRGSGTNTTLLTFEKQGTGTQTLSSSQITYTGATTVTGGTLRLLNTTAFASDITNNASVILEQTSASWTLARAITGTGSVTKLGVGTVILTGTSNYVGPTDINAGVLQVDGSLSGSIVNVNTGTLSGTGTIANAVNVGDSIGVGDSELSPGASIGTLATGAVTFNKDARFTLEINTTALTTDLLNSSGAVSLGLGVVPLNVSDLGLATLTGSEAFVFITAAGGVTGFFQGLPDGAVLTVGTTQFTIEYEANQVYLVVPEPGTVITLLSGVGMLLGLQRRRRAGRHSA